METLYPLIMKPDYKDYVWGGSRIPSFFNRAIPDGIYAESWEVSDRAEGPSVIANGPLAGRTLRSAVAEYGTSIIGTAAPGTSMPLLIKLIDAAQNLSVQVHPHDKTAGLSGGEPKTEMWYVLDAEDDAKIFAGLKPGTTAEAFRSAVSNNTLEKVLLSFRPKKGDVFFIPGGRVHAIGAGCLLLEVQQNSNTTYRVYDWGRKDSAGKARPLHIDLAMKVIDFEDSASPLHLPCGRGPATTLLDTDWFKLRRLDVRNEMKMESDGSTFFSLFSENGDFSVVTPGGTVACAFGQTCLVPASLRNWSLASDHATILSASL